MNYHLEQSVIASGGAEQHFVRAISGDHSFGIVVDYANSRYSMTSIGGDHVSLEVFNAVRERLEKARLEETPVLVSGSENP